MAVCVCMFYEREFACFGHVIKYIYIGDFNVGILDSELFDYVLRYALRLCCKIGRCSRVNVFACVFFLFTVGFIP